MWAILYYVLLILCSGYALWRGGTPERFAAATALLATAASAAVITTWQFRFRSPEFGVMIVDLITLAIFVAIAVKSDRYWPLWVAALQLVAIACGYTKLLQPNVSPFAYAIVMQIWSFLIVITIGVGAVLYRCRATRTY